MQTRSKTLLSKSSTDSVSKRTRNQLIHSVAAEPEITAYRIKDTQLATRSSRITTRRGSNLNEESCKRAKKDHNTYAYELSEEEEEEEESPKYTVDIDFDEASRAWRANKRMVGEGHFVYIRTRSATKSTRVESACCNQCDRPAVSNEFCGVHSRRAASNM